MQIPMLQLIQRTITYHNILLCFMECSIKYSKSGSNQSQRGWQDDGTANQKYDPYAAYSRLNDFHFVQPLVHVLSDDTIVLTTGDAVFSIDSSLGLLLRGFHLVPPLQSVVGGLDGLQRWVCGGLPTRTAYSLGAHHLENEQDDQPNHKG